MTPPPDPHPPSVPVVAVTCGDPAGIGPEVACLAWADAAAHARATLRLVADPEMVATVLAHRRGMPRLAIERVSWGEGRRSRPETLFVVDPGGGPIDATPRLGEISAAGGRAAVRAVEAAFAATRAATAAAIVTGPLHKEALHAAGYDVPGHTELLARCCGLPDDAASMMLWLPAAAGTGLGLGTGLGVVHATLHESLRTALARLSTPAIEAAGRRLAALLAALLGRQPRLAVAALNPHGGEGGLFGTEEADVVAPAVEALTAAGIAAVGPLPADTLFLRASRGEFDGVVALYHDQGHIPVKLLGMHRAVNITLGLPLVRTSVAHGTGFDIVATGRADPASMLAAIDAAARLVAAGWPGVTASGPGRRPSSP
ncbi:MAG: 4-hydroxythreonine-4-phosphate dehydrogenase PdxA [Planctomycetaceae bacterium]